MSAWALIIHMISKQKQNNMNREEIEKLIEESAASSRKKSKWSTDTVRNVLNTLFLLCGLVGVILYFAFPEQRITGMAIIGAGMFLKIIEFFLRFLF